MNREIWFRGKRMDNGEWVEGYFLHQRESLTDDEIHYIVTNAGFGFSYFRVRRNTIGQYTGQTDKNGVKIFEGDIVRTFVPKKCGVKGYEVGVVEFHKSAFSAVWSDFLTYGRNFIGYISDIEVIGNIHDNPELLGGSDGTTD